MRYRRHMSMRRPTGARASGQGITAIAVEGFKSIAARQRIDVRPLTLLAGANSSGKSSMMQPLLLLKQTLHSDYDPGGLLLDGANVRFTKADQILSRIGRRRSRFSVQLELEPPFSVAATYRHGSGSTAFVVESTAVTDRVGPMTARAGMSPTEIRAELGERLHGAVDDADLEVTAASLPLPGPFLALWEGTRESSGVLAYLHGNEAINIATEHLRDLIHVPAWRGDAKRSYPVTAVDGRFPGTFDRYVASLIAEWRRRSDQRHQLIERDLATLGLASELSVKALDETQLEVLVGRLATPRGRGSDLVNLADVGFGVSQCLPVVVAMLTAAPGRLVYIEEPEIHLHPRAQVALAELAVRAAKRRVRLVLETHSSLLLRGIQTAVARKEIAADQVALHWFERSDSGATHVRTAELADDGSFGDWPVDFDDVTLAAERDYLDAS
jgi:hypothetical protein